MPETTPESPDFPRLSSSLEAYLKAIWQVLHRSSPDSHFARVKDIAAIRGVKPGSVSPAMGKLAKLGLIVYERRNSISLTDNGKAIAEKLAHREQLLNEFFEDILQIPGPQARDQAIAVQHCLSDASTLRLERLIKHIRQQSEADIFLPSPTTSVEVTISEMVPGQRGIVRHIRAHGELNHQLIDMGLLPDSNIRLISGSMESSTTFVVALQGFEITLTNDQASAVVVTLLL
ncbi:MAG: metal-dependent transcriptional regulator [Deltaproteobacteria bacterium]|nr:metal-dependent transcriptional regulator [Deltaproteobacteria bacterium]